MSTLAPITYSRRALVELLAEARARTILLVSSLPEAEMCVQPEDSVESVLSELEQIIRFEGTVAGTRDGGDTGAEGLLFHLSTKFV